MMSNEFKTIPHLEVFDADYFETLVASFHRQLPAVHGYTLREASGPAFLAQLFEIARRHPEGKISHRDNMAFNAAPSATQHPGHQIIPDYHPSKLAISEAHPQLGMLPSYTAEVYVTKSEAELDAEVAAQRERLHGLYLQDISNYAQRKRDHLKAQFLAARAEEAAEVQRQRQAELDRIAAEEAAVLEAEVEAYIAAQLAPAKKTTRKANQEAA